MKTIQHTFIPGSPWVYIKLYTGQKTADDVLVLLLLSIIRKLKKKQYISKWFFIRYSDPQFHLRIRLLVNDITFIGEIINQFYKKIYLWNKNNLIWKVQLDTYNRELERYRRDIIEEAESVFYIDSECVISIIRKLNNNENHRWMISLKLIDTLMSDFGLNIEEKNVLMEKLSNSYKVEFGFNEHNSKQFNTKYRENKLVIESVLNNAIKEKEFVALYFLVENRSKQMAPIIKKIKTKAKRKVDLDEVLKSYLHMMINRLFRTKNRVHELVLYDFMRRYYTSEIARTKFNK